MVGAAGAPKGCHGGKFSECASRAGFMSLHRALKNHVFVLLCKENIISSIQGVPENKCLYTNDRISELSVGSTQKTPVFLNIAICLIIKIVYFSE